MNDLMKTFFAPKAVAIVGASRNERGLGHTVLKNMVDAGFEGKIYPVNPKASELLGLKVYPDLNSIPGEVDIVVVVVPQALVEQTIKEAVAKGVKGAVIITAGFRETGHEGAELEDRITKIARDGGLRFFGPNILGIIDTKSKLNTTFAAVQPAEGKIAFVSQSGALLTAVLDWAVSEGVGFSKIVSLGNKADLTEIDVFEALADDDDTRVIVAYLEGVPDGARFREVTAALTKKKPLAIVKSGRTAAGSRAVSSHTGSLAGSDSAYDAAFVQSGIIRANTMQDLFDISVAFASQPLPTGPSVAIVTNAGGPGILATDACVRGGLKLATLAPETIAKLREALPAAAALNNPVDVIGDATAERYEAAIDAVLEDPNVDALMVLLTPQAMTEIEKTAEAAVRAGKNGKKPVIAVFMGGDAVAPGVSIMKAGGVPNYAFPERAAQALRAMNEYREWRKAEVDKPETMKADKAAAAKVFDEIRKAGRDSLGELEARTVMQAYGFRMPGNELAKTADEAVKYAAAIGYPVVMKIVSPDILHKSDIGGVKVGLEDEAAVRQAFDTIIANANKAKPDADVWGVAVQEMVKPGREVILGVTRDPQFGQMIMFGLGGIYVEVLRDVSFRVAPLTRKQAEAMIKEIRSYKLLAGVRGQEPADFEALTDALLRVSQLVTDFPEIAELDVNPLVVYPAGKGATAVDARIILDK